MFIINNASWALFGSDIIILYLMLRVTRFGTLWRPDQISKMELLAKKVIEPWTIVAESFILDVYRVLNTSCGFILSHLSVCQNLHLNSNIKKQRPLTIVWIYILGKNAGINIPVRCYLLLTLSFSGLSLPPLNSLMGPNKI